MSARNRAESRGTTEPFDYLTKGARAEQVDNLVAVTRQTEHVVDVQDQVAVGVIKALVERALADEKRKWRAR